MDSFQRFRNSFGPVFSNPALSLECGPGAIWKIRQLADGPGYDGQLGHGVVVFKV